MESRVAELNNGLSAMNMFVPNIVVAVEWNAGFLDVLFVL